MYNTTLWTPPFCMYIKKHQNSKKKTSKIVKFNAISLFAMNPLKTMGCAHCAQRIR